MSTVVDEDKSRDVIKTRGPAGYKLTEESILTR